MPSPIEATIARYFAATRDIDKKAWVACFAPNGASHDPVGAPPHVGHEALGKYFDSIAGLVKTIGLVEDHVYVCGSQAAVKWTGRGLTKSGKPYMFEGIDVIEVDDAGRIRALYAYWDPSKLMAQLA